jgi:TRAP-type C4-dicarboxylate transport system permease small subunit
MSIVKRLCNILDKICKAVCVVLFAVITVAAFMQVFSRFILNNSWGWTDELCCFSLVWLAMFSASLGVRVGTHLAIDLVVAKTPKEFQQAITILSAVVIILFGAVLAVFGFQLSSRVMAQYSTTLHIPMGIVYMAVPISAIFMAVFAVEQILNTFAGRKKVKSTNENLETGGA